MEVISGGEETTLSVIKPCRMEVPLNDALDMNKSLHLSIDYLLRSECKDTTYN